MRLHIWIHQWVNESGGGRSRSFIFICPASADDNTRYDDLHLLIVLSRESTDGTIDGIESGLVVVCVLYEASHTVVNIVHPLIKSVLAIQ